jgi:hypothetical protein
LNTVETTAARNTDTTVCSEHIKGESVPPFGDTDVNLCFASRAGVENDEGVILNVQIPIRLKERRRTAANGPEKEFHKVDYMNARIKESSASAEFSSRFPFVFEAGSGSMAQNTT